MNNYDVTELAYKNGYNQAKEDFEEQIIHIEATCDIEDESERKEVAKQGLYDMLEEYITYTTKNNNLTISIDIIEKG